MTPKQEAFARAYVETGNASEAYRRAYNVKPDAKPDGIYVNACKLLTDTKVALRVSQLQAKHQKRHDITVDTITEMLKEDRDLARQNAQTGAAVSASMGLAKLHGLITEKREIKHVSGAEDLDDSELESLAMAGRGGTSQAPPRSSRAN